MSLIVFFCIYLPRYPYNVFYSLEMQYNWGLTKADSIPSNRIPLDRIPCTI